MKFDDDILQNLKKFYVIVCWYQETCIHTLLRLGIVHFVLASQ